MQNSRLEDYPLNKNIETIDSADELLETSQPASKKAESPLNRSPGSVMESPAKLGQVKEEVAEAMEQLE